MIMPCMNSTSAGEGGGRTGREDGGNVLVGEPGGPGCTTTGVNGSVFCACAADIDKNAQTPATNNTPALMAKP